MDASKLKDVLNRAKRITQMDVNGQLNEVANRARENGKMEYNDENIQYLQENQVPKAQTIQSMPNTIHAPKRNGIPKEIFESFSKNQIDTSPLNVSTSILDQIGITNKQTVQSKKATLNENKQPVRNVVSEQNISSNTGVEYSLIRMIVEDVVKKSMASLSKKMLTESKKNLNEQVKIINIGDKFSFVTDNGDLYEAKLVFKKNIKKK